MGDSKFMQRKHVCNHEHELLLICITTATAYIMVMSAAHFVSVCVHVCACVCVYEGENQPPRCACAQLCSLSGVVLKCHLFTEGALFFMQLVGAERVLEGQQLHEEHPLR